MAKTKARAKRTADVVVGSQSRVPPPMTIADLRQDPDLWFRICALIYDLTNMSRDKTSERRTLQTTDELYISAPYFSDDQVTLIKGASSTDTAATLEETLKAALGNFFEKRKASGDCRPCGPHDLAPLYLSCFGVSRDEIQDEAFIARLRRSGLGKA